MSTDVPNSYNLFIKLKVANTHEFLAFDSYVCAFESPNNLQPLVLEYTVAWNLEDITHESQKVKLLFDSSI